MTAPAASRAGSRPDAELENSLSAVEQRLSALGLALCDRDTAAVERNAAELHRALANAVDRFALAARSGSVPAALRHRLANTSGQVAAQRESLARATAALDRAIDVLMPRDLNSLYSTVGASDRVRGTGSIVA